MRNRDNSFTFILPAVTDGGGLASETREQGGRLGHLTVCRFSDCEISNLMRIFLEALGNELSTYVWSDL